MGNDAITQLFLQIQFVVVPILLYQQPFVHNYKRGLPGFQTAKIAALFSISIVLCMTFPVIDIMEGHIFDFRNVPLALAFLYGGTIPGLVATAVALTYRLIIGGAVLPAVGVTIAGAALAWLLIGRFRAGSYVRKISIAVGLMIVLFALGTLFHLFLYPLSTLTENFYIYFVFIPLLRFVTMFLAVFVIESFQEKLRLEQVVIGAERIGMIGQLSAAIAHEVRNPLTAVKGFLQLLGSESVAPDKRKEYIRVAVEEIDRADRIIHDYLTLARPQPCLPESVLVADSIKAAMLTMSSYAILHNVTLVAEELDRTMNVRGDAGKLSQVFVNILKNGIEAAVHSKGEKTVAIRLRRKDGMACIDISDTGLGMKRETMDKLGKAFYSNKMEGTGLGLMVVYRMVAEMEGAVLVESELGRGTTFTVCLPLQS